MCCVLGRHSTAKHPCAVPRGGLLQTLMFPNQEHGRMSVSDDGTLTIEPVQRDDAGQYICKGLSIAGSAYAKARLDVRGLTFYTLSLEPPPQPGGRNHLLLARLMGKYCFARRCLLSVVCRRRCRLSGSVTLPAGGTAAGHVGGWAPTLHGGPVRLRPVRATPNFIVVRGRPSHGHM